LKEEPGHDPMLKHFANAVDSWPKTKGTIFEVGFAWALLRACANGSAKLADVFKHMLPPNMEIPDDVGNQVLELKIASKPPEISIAGKARGATIKIDDWQKMRLHPKACWHTLTDQAGIDLAFWTASGTFVGVQAKSGRGKLEDAVASCTAAWQYVSRKDQPPKDLRENIKHCMFIGPEFRPCE